MSLPVVPYIQECSCSSYLNSEDVDKLITHGRGRSLYEKNYTSLFSLASSSSTTHKVLCAAHLIFAALSAALTAGLSYLITLRICRLIDRYHNRHLENQRKDLSEKIDSVVKNWLKNCQNSSPDAEKELEQDLEEYDGFWRDKLLRQPFHMVIGCDRYLTEHILSHPLLDKSPLTADLVDQVVSKSSYKRAEEFFFQYPEAILTEEATTQVIRAIGSQHSKGDLLPEIFERNVREKESFGPFRKAIKEELISLYETQFKPLNDAINEFEKADQLKQRIPGLADQELKYLAADLQGTLSSDEQTEYETIQKELSKIRDIERPSLSKWEPLLPELERHYPLFLYLNRLLPEKERIGFNWERNRALVLNNEQPPPPSKLDPALNEIANHALGALIKSHLDISIAAKEIEIRLLKHYKKKKSKKVASMPLRIDSPKKQMSPRTQFKIASLTQQKEQLLHTKRRLVFN